MRPYIKLLDENGEEVVIYGGIVYRSIGYLKGEGTPLRTNTAVTVLWDGTDYYVVSINGEVGYMSADQVGATRYATGGGGGSSGGGGGAEWSPPAL